MAVDVFPGVWSQASFFIFYFFIFLQFRSRLRPFNMQCGVFNSGLRLLSSPLVFQWSLIATAAT